MSLLLCLLGLLSIALGGSGAHPLASGDVPETLRPFFSPPAALAGDLGAYRSVLEFNDGSRVRTAEDWRRRREEILATWRELTGFWPPLIENPKVQCLDEMQRDDLTQHKVTVEIAPGGQTVAGYLLVPKGQGPFPAVLVVYYDAETGAGLGKELRDFGYQLARRGFVALSIGTTAFASLDAPYKPLWTCRKGSLRSSRFRRWPTCGQLPHTALGESPHVDPAGLGCRPFVRRQVGDVWPLPLRQIRLCGVVGPGIVFDEARPNVNNWEPWYLGGIPRARRGRHQRGESSHRSLQADGGDRPGSARVAALMAPRPFLVSGGAEDPPKRWQALNHALSQQAPGARRIASQ
jgi:hypothetical protein